MNTNILQDMFYYHNKVGNIDLHTIGCELSEWDGERLLEEACKTDSNSEKVIINTCAVTQNAQDASEMITDRLVKIYGDTKEIIITGCGVNYNQDYYKDKGICYINEDKFNALNYNKDNPYKSFIHDHDKEEGYVKVQDGCANNCAYCIVNKLREKPYSLPLSDIKGQVETLLKQGKGRINIIGTEITQYNSDGLTIDTLCETLLKEYPSIDELSINAMDPASRKVDRLIELMKVHPRMSKTLYLSVQSGSDKVLKDMNRHYDRQRIIDISNKAKGLEQVWDLVVGFPTETEEDFKLTYDLVKECHPIELMMCGYSSRIGSIASTLYDKLLPPEVITKRLVTLRDIIWNYEECELPGIPLRSKKITLDLYDTDKVIELCKELENKFEPIIIKTVYDMNRSKEDNKVFEVNAKLLNVVYNVYFMFKFNNGEPKYINDFLEYMNGVKYA